MELRLKIFRFDPTRESESHYDVFTVDAKPTHRLLDCLNKIRWEQDGSLAYRMSCAHGICGSDGMTINGVSALACQKIVKDFDSSKEILVEPLSFFTVVKDLVVNLEPFFEREKLVHPETGFAFAETEKGKAHLQSLKERDRFDDDIKCIMCACCVSACPVNLKEDQQYIGPAAIVRAHRYIFDTRIKDAMQRLKIMDKQHGVWSCKSYYKCTQVCPKGIRVTEHILEIKQKILNELRPKNPPNEATG